MSEYDLRKVESQFLTVLLYELETAGHLSNQIGLSMFLLTFHSLSPMLKFHFLQSGKPIVETHHHMLITIGGR